LPALYLRGISTGDFQEVLTALLGKDAPNLSPAVIARLEHFSLTRLHIRSL
jgi:putative transposase